jgi:hypothetical protein
MPAKIFIFTGAFEFYNVLVSIVMPGLILLAMLTPFT